MRFALLLKDDFSGATVADGAQRFFIDGAPARPVRKPDGFYVFLTPHGRSPGSSWRVRIESPRYEARELTVEADPRPPHAPLRIVQMYRRPGGGFRDCRWLEAKAPPGKLAVALVDGGDTPLALRGFSEDGRSLALSGYTAANLLWRRVCVGEGHAGELFTLTARTPEGGYAVDHPPCIAHPGGAPVRIAACGSADALGRCGIPVRPEWLERVNTILNYDEEAMQWLETW